ncbi:MAG: phosphoglucosamine mutase [Buchnera aphidicola (Nurudea shiraii)]
MNIGKYFGTDGIRGKVGEFPITPDFFLKFGFILGNLLFRHSRKKVIVGIDTRKSSFALEAALNSGLSTSGVSVISLGRISTPAVGYLTKLLKLELGIIISASHNLFQDNGIKLFFKNGVKISSKLKKIENSLGKPFSFKNLSNFSSIKRAYSIHKKYITFCKSLFPRCFSLKNFKIVLDCANGSTYKIAPKIFRDFGARLRVIFASPNGYNINKNCGSVNTNNLKNIVLLEKADFGLALDGDGDRVIMIDHLGNKVDGDKILYILAKFYLFRHFKKEGVVVTKMSNRGLLIGLKKLGIPFAISKVGDVNVIKKLKDKNWRFGAESSGHVIMLDKLPFCDGIVTSLQIIKIMIDYRMNLFELCSEIRFFPFVMINIKFERQNYLLKYEKIRILIFKYQNILSKFGRIYLRESGTETCFRIIVEDEDKNVVKYISDQIKEKVKHIGI